MSRAPYDDRSGYAESRAYDTRDSYREPPRYADSRRDYRDAPPPPPPGRDYGPPSYDDRREPPRYDDRRREPPRFAAPPPGGPPAGGGKVYLGELPREATQDDIHYIYSRSCPRARAPSSSFDARCMFTRIPPALADTDPARPHPPPPTPLLLTTTDYGRIHDIIIIRNSSIPFAFVEFVDRRDAEAAVRYEQGRPFMGCRVRVEMGKSRSDRVDNAGLNPATGRQKKTDWRVLVTHLPPGVTWTELKDHCRDNSLKNVLFVGTRSMSGNSIGIIEFQDEESMSVAIAKLNEVKFKGEVIRAVSGLSQRCSRACANPPFFS